MTKPYYKNVAGDFYVSAEGCCTLCGMPEAEAPEFFDSDEVQCFVKRQPQTLEEATAVIDAMTAQEFDCVRYGGSDFVIIQFLLDAGEGDQVDDVPLRKTALGRVQLHVRFRCELTLPSDIMARMVIMPRRDGSPYKTRDMADSGSMCTFRFGWHGKSYHRVDIRYEGPGRFLMSLAPSHSDLAIALARTVRGWMQALPGVSDVVWMTPGEHQLSLGRPKPC